MFRTELNINPSTSKVSLDTPILSMGSCFSDNIGQLLSDYKFDIVANPFGVIFNPISNSKLLHTALNRQPMASDGFLESQGIQLHYDVHSQLGGRNKEEVVQRINSTIDMTHHHLQKAKWLIITWGTAIVYERNDSGEIVANCHKVPAAQFNKRMLTQKEIIHDFEQLLAALPSDISVLLTVSPVRHLKETLELNAVSKSILRIACHSLAEQHDNVHYFPSYELMIDDLRDYRFYKSDMLHPTDESIKYIWGKFSNTYFDEATLGFITEWEKLLKAIRHKPFNPQSESHQAFIKKTIEQLKQLKNVDTTAETKKLEEQLIS